MNTSIPLEVSFIGNVYHADMQMGARVSEIGSLLGDPVRAAMLTALIDGRSLPAGELAFISISCAGGDWDVLRQLDPAGFYGRKGGIRWCYPHTNSTSHKFNIVPMW